MGFEKSYIEYPKAPDSISPCCNSFCDPMAVTIEDKGHDEQRFATIGADLLGRVLVVVYTYTDEEEIRLISARKATSNERRIYEKR